MEKILFYEKLLECYNTKPKKKTRRRTNQVIMEIEAAKTKSKNLTN